MPRLEDSIRKRKASNLELGIALEQQHVDSTQLLDVAVLFKLLADLRPDRGHGNVERVHGLDFGRLSSS